VIQVGDTPAAQAAVDLCRYMNRRTSSDDSRAARLGT
jgi:hypothetical protein